MEEHKRSSSISSNKSRSSHIMKVFSKKEASILGPQSYVYTDMAEVNSSPISRSEEMIKISDLKLAMYCHIVQNLILGKVFCTLIFLIGVSSIELLLIIPAMLLEFLGFCGSITLKSGPNYAFLIYLQILMLFRIFSIGYAYSLIAPGEICSWSDFSEPDSICDYYGKYIIGSLLFIAYEITQTYVTAVLIKKIKSTGETKKEEMYYVLTAQKIPRFICCGKLKSWKLVI